MSVRVWWKALVCARCGMVSYLKNGIIKTLWQPVEGANMDLYIKTHMHTLQICRDNDTNVAMAPECRPFLQLLRLQVYGHMHAHAHTDIHMLNDTFDSLWHSSEYEPFFFIPVSLLLSSSLLLPADYSAYSGTWKIAESHVHIYTRILLPLCTHGYINIHVHVVRFIQHTHTHTHTLSRRWMADISS